MKKTSYKKLIIFSALFGGCIVIACCIIAWPWMADLKQGKVVLGCDYRFNSKAADKLYFTADGEVNSQKFKLGIADECGFKDWYGQWAYSDITWDENNKVVALLVDESAINSKVFLLIKAWCKFAENWQIPYKLYILTSSGEEVAIESRLFMAEDAPCLKIQIYDVTKAICLNNQFGNGFMIDVADFNAEMSSGIYEKLYYVVEFSINQDNFNNGALKSIVKFAKSAKGKDGWNDNYRYSVVFL